MRMALTCGDVLAGREQLSHAVQRAVHDAGTGMVMALACATVWHLYREAAVVSVYGQSSAPLEPRKLVLDAKILCFYLFSGCRLPSATTAWVARHVRYQETGCVVLVGEGSDVRRVRLVTAWPSTLAVDETRGHIL